MKRKILSLALALTLVFKFISAFNPLALAAPSEATLTSAYKAYYEVLKASVDRYGVKKDYIDGDDVEWYDNRGVCYAELVDFDNEGLPELFFIYPDSVGGNMLYSVYGYSGKAELYYSGEIYGGEIYNCDHIEMVADRNGRRYLHRIFGDSSYDNSVHYYYYTVKDGLWVTALTLSFNYYDSDTEGVGSGYRWYINDELVNEQVFNNAPETTLGIVNKDIGTGGINYYNGSSTVYAVLSRLEASAHVSTNPMDSASGWARGGIADAINKGFVPTDIQCSYTNIITRQEFCRIAIKWVEYATGKNIDTVLDERGLSRNPNAFTDTNDPDILAAFALGITSGTGNKQFMPLGEFTREQAATMIMNACGAIGAIILDPQPAFGFVDIESASSWAVKGINFVNVNGIMYGTGIATFNPMGLYTREQSIITFNNINHNKFPGHVPATQNMTPTELGSIIQFGRYDWRVLDMIDGKALIISEYVLEERRYNDGDTGVTWENCDLREYLNKMFYNSFSESDRARIAETGVTTNDNPWYGTDGGRNTTDKIFLLSFDEVVKYFGDSGQLQNGNPNSNYHIIDEYNNARVATDKSGEKSQWWLRSPGSAAKFETIVDLDGTLDVAGGYFSSVPRGVRPALWLKL